MSPEVLCVVAGCAAPNQHAPHCDEPDTCGGCQPNRATDGLRICRHHYETAKRNLRDLPALDRDLSEAFVKRSTIITAYTTGSPGNMGITLDQNVLEAREYLTSRLTVLASYICDERGITPPSLTVPGLVTFTLRHAEWLSADRLAAPNWTTQIRNIHTEASRNAYRSRQTSIKLGICPGTKPDGSICGTTVRHDPSDYAGQDVTCRGCGQTDTVDGWQTTMWGAGNTHLTADAIASLLTTRYNRLVPPSTIRAWASKGFITRHADDGRTLYDIGEVRAHADTVWNPVHRTAS